MEENGAGRGAGQEVGAAPALRRLVASDAAAVQALAAGLRRYFSPPDLREIARLLREQPAGWVALAGPGMVGFVLEAPTPDPHVRELAWMAVTEEWQGRGIGGALLEKSAAAARATGHAALEVSTVAESAGYAPYAATRAFYHHRGFVDVRVDPDYYWPGGDRLILRRAL